MKEEIKLFLQKVAEDEDLQKKLQGCKSPEEAYEIASAVQEGFTFEEFTETMTKLRDEMGEELTGEDLAKVSGGTMATWVSVIMLSTEATVLAAMAGATD